MPGRLEEGSLPGPLPTPPAPPAQVKLLPSRPLALPTLFRNRVPETGRAAGREARSVPVSFPLESPCGISFRTVRKSEREAVGGSGAPRLPRLSAAGRAEAGGGSGAGLHAGRVGGRTEPRARAVPGAGPRVRKALSPLSFPVSLRARTLTPRGRAVCSGSHSRQFKNHDFVNNPNPVFFVYVSLPDGEAARGRGDSWRTAKGAGRVWGRASPPTSPPPPPGGEGARGLGWESRGGLRARPQSAAHRVGGRRAPGSGAGSPGRRGGAQGGARAGGTRPLERRAVRRAPGPPPRTSSAASGSGGGVARWRGVLAGSAEALSGRGRRRTGARRP